MTRARRWDRAWEPEPLRAPIRRRLVSRLTRQGWPIWDIKARYSRAWTQLRWPASSVTPSGVNSSSCSSKVSRLWPVIARLPSGVTTTGQPPRGPSDNRIPRLCYTKRMRRPILHLVLLLVVAAIIPGLFRVAPPEANQANSQDSSSRSPLRYLRPALTDLLWLQKARWLPRLAPEESAPAITPKATEPPIREFVFSPRPSGIHQGVLPVEQLTVSELGLGWTQAEMESFRTPNSVYDRGNLEAASLHRVSRELS